MNSIVAARMDSFTAMFERARFGDRIAANLVYGLALPRLRRIAGSLLRRYQSHDHLQPTALVSELFLKIRGFNVRISDREHFFRISARAMYQVLADQSRTHAGRIARNSVRLEERVLTPPLREVLPVAIATLDRFQRIDPPAAAFIRLHFVEGHTWDEISQLTGTPLWKIRADAKFAVEWMRAHLV